MRNRATTPLSRAKIRQSWSKYNLYNLQRFRNPSTSNRTFFQQKWTAKSAARAYHGEQVPETQWERMFSRRIRSVVPMDATRLAQDDGSIASSGRGSGIMSPWEMERAKKEKLTPFTQMTFAPLERRLDTAIFRALFASSTRQARQFVVHGAVTVNGKEMRYPGYLLNPGDMFQVDPERVMFATGAPKSKAERREGRIARQKTETTEEGEEGAAEEQKEGKEEQKPEAEEAQPEDTRETLKGLMAQAKTIMSKEKSDLPAKKKQELRGFQKAIKRVLSRSESSSILNDNLESQFSELMTLLKAKRVEKKADSKGKNTESQPAAESSEPVAETEAPDSRPGQALTEAFQKATENPAEEVDTSELTEDELDTLKRALIQMRDNPIDSTKPYATPWRPRDYMSAFAFIPRYLEVNQNICAAVYLRHPVARPGFSEVPSPFSESINTAAFAWYLRRR
ncbi:hypothetical protein SI65_01266 [Aspergillus cristatus]|uniref:Small ribosomal subunit protein uS4m n=1 Tax=Aspergillus cristatus TaxID=573508 RepID=A0A1E3BS21_ASPCR|nr:hypothetical protein SI65_01266 [Aspergillus cristatus]